MRPVPSRRWEATRVKAGSISTSAKSSRTKGSSMQFNFNRNQCVATEESEPNSDAIAARPEL